MAKDQACMLTNLELTEMTTSPLVVTDRAKNCDQTVLNDIQIKFNC